MYGISCDERTDSKKVGELFLGNDPRKLKPKLFKQFVFPSHENE